MAKKRHLTHCH